jgi:hypothetical protein
VRRRPAKPEPVKRSLVTRRAVRRRELTPVLLGWVVLAGLRSVSGLPSVEAGSSVPGKTERGTRSFVFERLNREYRNEVTRPAPREQGGFRLRLTSPQNRVRLTRHELFLTPLPDGSHRAALTVEFEGAGQVEAEISIAGAVSRIEDQVTVPLQSRTLEGRVRIERVPQGFLFTALELPERVTVTIESGLAGRFLQTCNLLQVLVPLDCNALGSLLSRVVFPLPDPGGSYLLPNEELTPQDRAGLEDYLRSSA